MNYLIYIEHAAENLQFYLWYRDYVKRFDNMPPSEHALAPVWTVEQAEAEAMVNQNNQNALGPKTVSRETAAVFKGTDVSCLRGFYPLHSNQTLQLGLGRTSFGICSLSTLIELLS